MERLAPMTEITDSDRIDYLIRHSRLCGNGKRVTEMVIKFPANGDWEALRPAIDEAIRNDKA